MHDGNEFLKALATVLCVAAVTTVLFQRLKQPVVLGYLLAGLIVGPYVPIPLAANAHIIETLSELGVILLMFSLGLEFSLRKLIRVGPTAGLTALIQCGLMLWLGFNVGRLFGWTSMESLFTGAIIAISSTTIIAKAFDERGIKGEWRELVVAILIVEDLIAILLMATLTALTSGAGLSAGALALTAGKLFLFLAGLVAGGLLLVPRTVRAILALNRPETTVVACIGICFATALLAQAAGYSVALGAFLGGSLVAESGEGKSIEHLIQPVRDVFAAVFFVSVGMLIDPRMVAHHWAAVLVLTLVVVLGKILSVSLGAFLTGNGVRRSVQAGMSLAQIGEFSFIIAGLGLSMHAIRDFLYPIAVAVSAITTLLTPWLISSADPAARLLDRKLPHSLQTFTTLYGSWLEELRTREHPRGKVTRLVRLLILDAALLTGIIIGAAVASRRLYAWMAEYTRLSPSLARVAVIAAAFIASIPFLVGIFRLAGRLGLQLAESALPPGEKLDLAAAPRKALVVTLQLTVILALGIPIMAIIQPFVRGVVVAIVLMAAVAFLGVAFWRSAANLQGHVLAGAGMIVEALASQASSTDGEHPDLAAVSDILPGLGEPKAVRLQANSFATGRTLAQLNLRGNTGATVLALVRKNQNLGTPDAHQPLEADDLLALAGTSEAVGSAEALLLGSGHA